MDNTSENANIAPVIKSPVFSITVFECYVRCYLKLFSNTFLGAIIFK